MRVLGVEGTAWAASAAVYDTETDSIHIESDPYIPESGGIHPREAAEHMTEAIPRVIDDVLTIARNEYGHDCIDAVAFSRGPGLGPCLRTVGTAARALAGTLDVPLVGVNHMVAHLEIGRHQSGFDSPVCLNASGANAHLLGYHNGRYRVLGETMDTGVGNAIDKFTRHVGWAHPGGPKVEQAAQDGEFIDLPYVVKGMDFSFSGIMTAAKEAYDEGQPVEDICFSLQEHIFAMLTEVSERALSLTGTDELVLGGGVGQNERLCEMLRTMCAERGAEFFVPEDRFLMDNAGMIAVLGAKMAAAGDTIEIPESTVNPNFRPDEVPVTWRTHELSGSRDSAPARDAGTGSDSAIDVSQLRGAEAVIEKLDADRIRKRRVVKAYRHPILDDSLRRDRTVLEARLTSEARRAGVPTPLVWDVNVPDTELLLQAVGDVDLARALTPARARAVGRHLARLHGAGIVHGDPTTRNVRVETDTDSESASVGEDDSASCTESGSGSDASLSPVERGTFLIDFGLGFHTGHVEDHAMDLHVFEQSVHGTADDPDPLVESFEDGYARLGDDAVIERLRGIEGRGRYQ